MFEQPNEDYVQIQFKDALDKLLILHADHEQNCSTSTVRIVGSSHAGLFASFLQVFLHFGDHSWWCKSSSFRNVRSY